MLWVWELIDTNIICDPGPKPQHSARSHRPPQPLLAATWTPTNGLITAPMKVGCHTYLLLDLNTVKYKYSSHLISLTLTLTLKFANTWIFYLNLNQHLKSFLEKHKTIPNE